MQVKKEINYMFDLVEENIHLSFDSLGSGAPANGEKIAENEAVVNFTNGALTKFLIKLSAHVEQSDEFVIGSYFHVLNDLERIGDHAENFYDISAELSSKGLAFSEKATKDIKDMCSKVLEMLALSKKAFTDMDRAPLTQVTVLENEIDTMKTELTASHFSRLAEGNCSFEVSPYYSSTIAGLERVADHLVNVGYSIVNPIGSQNC